MIISSADTPDAITAVRARAEGKSIVFVSGKFNILHPGHIRLLEFARTCGDVLVVGVVQRGVPGISVAGEERLASVRALAMVDETFLVDSSVEDCLRRLHPDVVVKGREYANLHNVEQSVVESYGGRLLFSSGELRYSSLTLLQNEYDASQSLRLVPEQDFPKRHGFTTASILDHIAGFSKLTVTVVGDLIVDDYVDCEPLGMSREDPTIVVSPLTRRRFVGGAGIVAAHARGLGAKVNFVTVAGSDEVADYAEAQLIEKGIDVHIVRDPSRPTTLKTRYRAAGKTLLRVSELRQHAVEAGIARAMLDHLNHCVGESDVLVFSDFNYGCLPQELVDELIEQAGPKGVLMAADSQASSQMSDVSRFRGMDLLTPTEREARLAIGDFALGLAAVGETLSRKAAASNIVLTLGGDGMLILGDADNEFMTDRLAALNPDPKDTAGAGDSFLITASMALRLGMTIWQASYLGAVAAAIQVSRVGNVPLSLDDITQAMRRYPA